MKTFKQWEKSGIDLDDFLQPMDEVDERLYLYAGEIVAPKYCSNSLIQMGEAHDKIHGIYHYMTFRNVGFKYYYLGILPEFKS